ncbi:hypothetical protein NORO109296_05655 [Nocardiopsis rhodophaea]
MIALHPGIESLPRRDDCGRRSPRGLSACSLCRCTGTSRRPVGPFLEGIGDRQSLPSAFKPGRRHRNVIYDSQLPRTNGETLIENLTFADRSPPMPRGHRQLDGLRCDLLGDCDLQSSGGASLTAWLKLPGRRGLQPECPHLNCRRGRGAQCEPQSHGTTRTRSYTSHPHPCEAQPALGSTKATQRSLFSPPLYRLSPIGPRELRRSHSNYPPAVGHRQQHDRLTSPYRSARAQCRRAMSSAGSDSSRCRCPAATDLTGRRRCPWVSGLPHRRSPKSWVNETSKTAPEPYDSGTR